MQYAALETLEARTRYSLKGQASRRQLTRWGDLGDMYRGVQATKKVEVAQSSSAGSDDSESARARLLGVVTGALVSHNPPPLRDQHVELHKSD